MIGRIVWFIALAAIALLIVMLQLDMRTKRVPTLANVVPTLLRNQAQAPITQQALGGTDKERALIEAKTLVLRRPLPAENLVLLAAAQVKAGQMEAAVRTIQAAGRRGWREPVSQQAMLRLALGAGDRAEAARRYAALFLSDSTPDALLLETGPAVLEGPDRSGRDTLVAIIVGGDRWHNAFLRRGARIMPPAAFAAIAADSLARGAPFECNGLRDSLAVLVRRDAAAAASLRAQAVKRCPRLAA